MFRPGLEPGRLSLELSALTMGPPHLLDSASSAETTRQCSSYRKLIIPFVVIAAAVIVLWLGGIVSVVCSIVLSNGCEPFM